MIPFSGFMPGTAGPTPSTTGPAPAAVGKTAAAGKTAQAPSPADGSAPAANTDARSFMQWIRQLMDGEAPAGKTGKAAADPQNGGNNQEVSPYAQLQALIEKAMAQPKAGASDDQSEKTKGLDALSGLIPPWIIQALLARNDTGKPVDKDLQKALLAIENAAVPSKASTAEAKDQPLSSILAGMTEPASPAKDQLIKEANKQTATTAKSGKEPLADALKAASDGVETASTDSDHDAAKSFTAAADESKQAADGPAPAHLHGSAAHNKAAETASILQTGAKPNAPRGDGGDSADSDKHHEKDRPALKTIDASQLTKTHPQDSLKGSVAGGTQTQTSFQDSMKSMPVDPSAHLSGKSNVGQTTPLPRLDASTANMYQTSVMDQIVDKATVRLDQGRSEVQIRLKPDFLGNVHMNIASDKDQIVVRIVTDQPVVKDIIETHLHQLRADLQNQGLVIHRFDVQVNPDAARHQHSEQFSQTFRHHSYQNNRRQPGQQNPQPWNQGGGKPSDDEPSGFEGVNYFA
jgi:flagellar hook-length control protein FliK